MYYIIPEEILNATSFICFQGKQLVIFRLLNCRHCSIKHCFTSGRYNNEPAAENVSGTVKHSTLYFVNSDTTQGSLK